eukprot:gene11439-biopygen12412
MIHDTYPRPAAPHPAQRQAARRLLPRAAAEGRRVPALGLFAFFFTKATSPAGLKTRQNPGNPTSWGCHQGAISGPDEVPMGLETAVLHRNDHVWCPGGSCQALGNNPCRYIFFIPAATSRWEGAFQQECGGCNTAHPFMWVLFLNGITHITSRRVHVPVSGMRSDLTNILCDQSADLSVWEQHLVIMGAASSLHRRSIQSAWAQHLVSIGAASGQHGRCIYTGKWGGRPAQVKLNPAVPHPGHFLGGTRPKVVFWQDQAQIFPSTLGSPPWTPPSARHFSRSPPGERLCWLQGGTSIEADFGGGDGQHRHNDGSQHMRCIWSAWARYLVSMAQHLVRHAGVPPPPPPLLTHTQAAFPRRGCEKGRQRVRWHSAARAMRPFGKGALHAKKWANGGKRRQDAAPPRGHFCSIDRTFGILLARARRRARRRFPPLSPPELRSSSSSSGSISSGSSRCDSSASNHWR